MALLFGALAFFSKRFIEQNDKQHEKTRSHINTLSKEIRDIKETIKGIELTYEKLRASGRFDGKTAPEEIKTIKRKVSSSIIEIHKIQKDLDKILPKVAESKKAHGEVVWIKDEISKQNRKLATMFKIVEKLVKTP